MKILGLFLLLLCLLATSQAQTSSSSPRSDQLTTQGSRSTADPFILQVEPDRRAWSGGVAGFSCAYLRTYRVKREYRGSDVVSPAGYTECVPLKRFEVRSAVQVQTEAAARE